MMLRPSFLGARACSAGAVILADLALFVTSFLPATAAPLPIVNSVEWQPLAAQIERVVQAAEFIGEPLAAREREAIDAAVKEKDAEKLQTALDARCLFGVHINAEMRVKVQQGPAKPELMEQGWRSFLVKVHNEAGTTAALEAVSPNALSLWERDGRRDNSPSGKLYRGANESPKPDNLWLDLAMFDKQPLRETLGGLALNTASSALQPRRGQARGQGFIHVGQSTQDLGFRSEVDVLFDCIPPCPSCFE
jgi:hypothetical protein